MLQKVQKKMNEKADSLKVELTEQFEKQMQQVVQSSDASNKAVAVDLRQAAHDLEQQIDGKVHAVKNEMGRQMHEICSMVEELAAMTKGLEFQLGQKKTEIESASLNIANMQRKQDEGQRETQLEFSQLKNRQHELTQLYSTYLDSEDQLLLNQ